MDYPKSQGAVFPNKDKVPGNPATEKFPDFKGSIEVTTDQLKMLVMMAKSGQTPKIQIAEWDRVARQTGVPYRHISTEVYMPQTMQPPVQHQPYQQYPQQQYQQPIQQQPQYQQPPVQQAQSAPAPAPQQPTTMADFADDDLPF